MPKITAREEFLSQMDRLVPWKTLVNSIKSYYYSDKFGKYATPIESMLRIYFLQIWFSLSEQEAEDAIIDIAPMRNFLHVSNAELPDAEAIENFKHIIDKYKLHSEIFNIAETSLLKKNLTWYCGTILDATVGYVA